MISRINFKKYEKKKNVYGAILDPENFPATEKWLEYSLDILDLRDALLTTSNFDEKFKIMKTLEIAERKRDWHYKHKCFDVKRATFLFNRLKNAKRVTNTV